jgi:hypothetical protein
MKLRSLLALFAILVGTSFAPLSVADTSPQAQQPPVDCKKTPNDPACKGKK